VPLPIRSPAEVAEQAARIPSLEEAKETGSSLMLPIVDPEVAAAVLSDRQVTLPVVESEVFTDSTEPEPKYTDDSPDVFTDAPSDVFSGVLSELSPIEPFVSPEVPLLVLRPDSPVRSTNESEFEEPLPFSERTFHTFSESLQTLTTQQGITEAGKVSPAPQIVAAVSERLGNLEAEQEAPATMLIEQITETISEIRQLQAVMAGPMELVDLEEHLTDLCEALLETIGVEYDAESLSQFVHSLLRPEFMPELTKSSKEVDLERMGTHEVKRHFPGFFTILADLFSDAPARYLLGKFALFVNLPMHEPPGHRSGPGKIW